MNREKWNMHPKQKELMDKPIPELFYGGICGGSMASLHRTGQPTCKNCGAPEDQRVFRHSDGKQFTQSWEVVCSDPEYSPNATMIYLDKDYLCRKCRQPKP